MRQIEVLNGDSWNALNQTERSVFFTHLLRYTCKVQLHQIVLIVEVNDCDCCWLMLLIRYKCVLNLGTNAAISDHLLSEENSADTDSNLENHEKPNLAELELMQNRNQHHRIMNTIQSIQR